MSAGDLVRELEGFGVEFWEDAGQLRFRAPVGLMTEGRLATLREHKEDVLAHVRDGGPVEPLSPDPGARYEPFPVTDVQAAYLLGRRDVFEYGGVACHGYGELEFELELLDPARMQVAWQALVDRHDMLRAIVEIDGSQRVLRDVPAYEVAVRDLRGHDRAAIDAELTATRAAMDHRLYDPAVWPLFDVRITRADERSYLHISVDFLIADFVSIQLMIAELHALYADPGAPLAPLDITYRDYLFAERRTRSGPRHERDRAYWLERLDTLPPAPELPLVDDVRRAPPRFVRQRLSLDVADWASLRTRAGVAGVTPSCAVLGAYAAVVGRWSRRSAFTLDVTLLNRLALHPQVDQLVGDFTSVNLLEVRDGAAGTSFSDDAQAIQAQLWEDLDHTGFTGVELVRELSRRRGAGAALFPIVFTSAIGLGATAGEPPAGPLSQLGYGISQTPQVWIDCQVMERPEGLSLNWDVRVGVFPDGVVEAMFTTFEQLLRSLATQDAAWEAQQPAAGLPAGQLERRRRVNATAAALPDALLHDGAAAQAIAAPERTAVVDAHGQLTYEQLLGRARGVADVLRAAGARPADGVAIAMEKGCDQVVGALAVLLAGGAYVPVDLVQPAARRARMLELAGVRHVLTQSHVEHAGWPEHVELLDVDRVETVAAPSWRGAPRADPNDIAYVVFTSGSTGAPKGVMVTHRAAQNTIQDVSSRFGIGAGDRVLGLASLGFDLSVYDVFGTLALGACLVLPDPQRRGDPAHWSELVERHGVSVWNSVPAQLQMLSQYLSGADVSLPMLRLGLLSGDWIPVALPDEIRSRLPGLRLVSLGGATEAAIWSIYHEIGEVPAHWRSIPYGRPLANQTMHVLDAHLRDRPDWVVGELFIGGAGLARGYIGDDAQTAERFIQAPGTAGRLYRTGDLGRFLPDGEIEFLGREDFQVKIRGHRIELAEVEAALSSHPDVAAATVLAHGETPLERRLAAFLEPARVAVDDVDRAPRAVVDAAAAAGAEVMRDVDLDVYLAYAKALNDVALLAMIATLREAGLFATPDDTHGLEEILERLGPAPAHHRLVRRWLRALTDSQTLRRDEAGRYGDAPLADARVLEQAWTRVAELQRGVDDGAAELLTYFRASTQHLPALLRGDRDPLQLLFPDGQLEVAESLYRDALVNRYGTAMLSSAIGAIAAMAAAGGPLRVLEVGAGVGGTTGPILSALAGRDVDYLFTDLSRFFINFARERFVGDPGMRFAVFDLEGDHRAQGLAPNSFDVVIAADVIHSTRDVGEALGRLADLVAPGGWLLFLEMTRDQYQIMASLELLTRVDEEAGDFLDSRRGRDQTFLSSEEWSAALEAAGAEPAFVLPAPGEPLAELGMTLFAARFKRDLARPEVDDLRRHMSERVPEYMLPATIDVVGKLPLTANAKIDRAQLHAWLAAATQTSIVAPEAEPETDLERRVAAVWAEMFGVQAVARDRDFFDLGGDSLLAAQVAGRIREIIPEAQAVFFDDLLRKLLEGTTVAQLATAVTDGAGFDLFDEQPDVGSPFVQLGGPGAAPPHVLVHDTDGTLASFDPLVEALALEGPVLGLRGPADGLPIEDPAALICVAAAHARLLLSEGHLAVHLIGLDGGALLALEMARQLLGSGADVAGLTISGLPDAESPLSTFEPELYLGDVRVLVPEDDPPAARQATEDFWRGCCLGGVEIVAVGGTSAAPSRRAHAASLLHAIAAAPAGDGAA